MKFLEKLCWRKSHKENNKSCTSDIDFLEEKLNNTILDTREVSNRIIAKLENKVSLVEQQLSEREELLYLVFNSIPDLLILKDSEGRWKIINNYTKKFFGLLTPNEYKNKTDAEIAEISPRYKDMLEICASTDEQVWLSRESLQLEKHTHDSFGIESIFDVVKTPIYNPDGSRKHLLVHGKNVTDEVNNTKHIKMLLTALDKASDSISVTDHNDKVIYANEAFCNTYGYALNEILDKPRNFFLSRMDNFVLDNMYKTLGAAHAWVGELFSRDKDGIEFKELVHITPILNGKPYPIYYICVNRPL